LFKPLHDDIYAFLGTIPNDGTNNQSKPVVRLLQQLDLQCIAKNKNKNLQSLDLSAATDRLPVVLQSQVLNILGFDGDG
jgi:hypothetical protein